MPLLALLLLAFQSQPADRELHWREDLKFFGDEFPAKHVDFNKLYSRTAFDKEVANLQESIARLTDTQITLRLMKLVASANVGHTTVYLPFLKLGFKPMPIGMQWFSDGLAVTAAPSEYNDALGARVVKIGFMTPEEVLTKIAPYIAHENDIWLKQESPNFLQLYGLLSQVGAVEEGKPVTLTLAKPGGQPFTIEIPWNKVEARTIIYDALKLPQPLFRKNPNAFYWRDYLPDSKALYIQYNKCANDPALSFADFVKGAFEFVDSNPVERVVLDLRFNGGGNSIIIYPLRRELQARPKLAAHTYVLIGPGTFSSAQDNALEFRDKLHTVLIGEPTGEKINSYGEVRQIQLPNSGLQVQYCTRFFHMTKDSDAISLTPDVIVPRTLEDMLSGRDPVLDAALKR